MAATESNEALVTSLASATVIHPISVVVPAEQPRVSAFLFLSLPAELRLIIYRLLFQVHIVCHLSLLSPTFSIQRHPAILQTNRFIYSEAIAVLYKEITAILMPGDVIGLRKYRYRGFPNPLKPWRHNPLDDPGHNDGNGKWLYRTLELGGDIYPHVFSRFQRIGYWAYFHFFSYESGPTRRWKLQMNHDHSDADFREDERDRLLEYLNRIPIFPLLVKLLSRVPYVRTLNIRTNVRVPVDNYFRFSAKKELLANIKSTELFMMGGLLEPLRGLKTVKYLFFTNMIGQDIFRQYGSRALGIEAGTNPSAHGRSKFTSMPQCLALIDSIHKDVWQNWSHNRHGRPDTGGKKSRGQRKTSRAIAQEEQEAGGRA